MEQMSDKFRKAKFSLAEFVQTSFIAIIIVQISIVAIPYLKDAIKANNLPASMTNWLFVLHMLLGGLSIFATLKIKSFIQATNIVKIEESFQVMESDSMNLKDIIGKFYMFSYCNLWALRFLESNKGKITSKTDAMSDIQEILQPLIIFRSELFNFKGSDKYNIALYLFNAENGLLEPFFRMCDDRIETHNRSWSPPFGYIGYAYYVNDVIISSEYPLYPSATTANELETDKEYYASCIAASIPGNWDHGKPVGVLMISSSREKQFVSNDQHLQSFVKEYVLILSQYFSHNWNPEN